MSLQTRFAATALLCTSAAISSLTISAAADATKGQIKASLPDGNSVIVTAINANVIKVTNLSAGESVPESRATLPITAAFDGSINHGDGMTTLTTSTGVKAVLNTKTGAVSISAGPGKGINDNGERTLKDGKRELQLTTDGVGSFYGGGERGHKINLAGDTLVMYNKQNYGYVKGESRISQMNITMPLFLSSNGYALLFDDYAAAQVILGNPIKYISESPAPISYYYIYGDGSMKGLTKEVSQLTGRQDMPPFWAMGYTTSKYGYKTETETRGIIDTLKMNKYPVDGIVLDLYWYGKEQDMGRLAWDPEQWPTHKQMLADLKAKGVNTIIISQPYVLRNSRGIDKYNMGVEKGLFVKDSTDSLKGPQEVQIWVGEGGMWDVSNPDTRKWLANRYKELTLEGVGGWWGDLGEPEVHPETGIHHNGLTARQYHNQYGNDWSQIIYDLYKEEFPNTRLMTMMRGGTTGLQRYSVYPWSTDVSRSWGGLQPQVTIMLGAGLSGLGYMSHDVGGFALDEKVPYDPELYVRWLQLGTFSPILRTHAQGTAEPFRYPDQQHIILPLIKERYRWLPYNYTLAYENHAYGTPLVRSIGFYEPGETKYDNIDDEYLWGKDVLIAPVMTQGATSRSVTFPAGTWVNYATPSKTYAGGSTITYNAPLEVLPMFVRGGSIIPTADYDMENTGDYKDTAYTLNVYPVAGCQGSYTLFEDDRTSTSTVENGKYALLTFTDSMTKSELEITLSKDAASPTTPSEKEIKLLVNNIQKAPKSVTIDGKRLNKKEYAYDKQNKVLSISGMWNPANARTITVSL